MTFEQFIEKLVNEATRGEPKKKKKNDALLLENYVNVFLKVIYEHNGPFTQEQLKWGREAVLRWMKAHDLDEDDENPADQPQDQKDLAEFRLAASQGDKNPAYNPQNPEEQTPDDVLRFLDWLKAHDLDEGDKSPADHQQMSEEQTQDDEPELLGKLKAKGDELSFVAYNQEIYVRVKNATNKKLSKLVLKKEGQEKILELSSSDSYRRFYLIENITEPEEITDFIAGHEQSPNTHDIIWS